jgi:hypothetical protein
MSSHQAPDPGTTVTFLNADPNRADICRRGVATGPAVHDPRTDQDWIPVVCPDRDRVLVHRKLVVDERLAGSPKDTRIAKTPESVRDAVLKWTCRVAILAASSDDHWVEIATILEELLTALSPMRRTMDALRDADPSGELVQVVLSLVEATWQVNEGHLSATRKAIVTSANALAHYLTADE